MKRVVIDESRCKGCGLCTLACTRQVLAIGAAGNAAGYRYAQVIKPEQCISCALCAVYCPDAAITVFK